MSRSPLFVLVTLTCLTAGVAAQQPMVGATVTQDLSVAASAGWPWGWISSESVPVGPLPAGGVTLLARTGIASASMHVGELRGLPAGVSGYQWSTWGAGGGWESGACGASGAIELRLTLPEPTEVIVFVEGEASGLGDGSTWTTVDVDHDGVADLTLEGGSVRARFDLLVGPTGTSIGLAHASGADAGSTSSDLRVTFHPRDVRPKSGAGSLEPMSTSPR